VREAERRETIHVPQGEVTIEIASGPALTLKPGDLASLPATPETAWYITLSFSELWVLTRPVALPLPHPRSISPLRPPFPAGRADSVGP
jgi:EutQ-like cupin domain